ncbi:MAG: cytochrome b/b6 domain-containing protein [Burkholderiaceae bacterium]
MVEKRVWDLPLRLFHWSLALLVVVSLVTQQIGGNAMEWHFLSGYAVLALLLFRLAWGLVGSRYARFSSFLYAPAEILAYLRGAARRYHGHNPLGSLSVFALLGVVLAQAVSGLFANDDIASEGPLVKFISKDWSDSFTWFHKAVSGNLIYALIGLHIAAIVYYCLRKKQNLVKPMLTGDKVVDADTQAADDSWRMRLLALALLAISAAVVYGLINLKA